MDSVTVATLLFLAAIAFTVVAMFRITKGDKSGNRGKSVRSKDEPDQEAK